MVQLYNTEALASVHSVAQLFELMTLDLDDNDTPFSMRKQARLFLTNIANRHPAAAKAFLYLCRGESDTAFRSIRDSLTPSMQVETVNPFLTPGIFPLALMVFERLAAHEVASVQVADRPQSKVFYLSRHVEATGLIQLRVDSHYIFAETRRTATPPIIRWWCQYGSIFDLAKLCEEFTPVADAIALDMNNRMLEAFMADGLHFSTIHDGSMEIFRQVNSEATHLILGKGFPRVETGEKGRSYPGLRFVGTLEGYKVFEHDLPGKDYAWALLRRGSTWAETPYVLMPYLIEDAGHAVNTRAGSYLNPGYVASGN